MARKTLLLWAAICAGIMVWGCTSSRTPIDEIRRRLGKVPTYSVILEDMNIEGNFIKNYYHKYRIVGESDQTVTDWMKVSEKYYKKHLSLLGMTLLSKKNGQAQSVNGPAGYEYVGDSRYGRWDRNSSGASFWVFYGQYRLMSDLLGGRRISRRDHDAYRSHQSRRQPYYGPNREFGTNGKLTKSQKPDFYRRASARQNASKNTFGKRVNQRIGRTRSGLRSRSYGRGK